MGIDLLVVAAWAPELESLGRRLPTRIVGVGLVEAAAGAARALAEMRPTAVVLIGTAGRFSSAKPQLGDVVVARRIHLASSAVKRGDAYWPAPLPTTLETDARLRRGLRLPSVDVRCPLAISKRASRGTDVENLEAFAVGRAAAAARIPFACVLGVANDVGPGGHRQWKTHAADAAAAACEAVLRAPSR